MLCVLCYERSVAVGNGKRREEGNLKKSAAVKAEWPEWEAGTPVSRSGGQSGGRALDAHTRDTTADGGEEQLNGKLRLAQRSPKLLLVATSSPIPSSPPSPRSLST